MPDVFFYRCDQPGAPVLGDTANSLNALLYACLVTGFGSTGLVSITRTGSVATGSTASAHTFAVGDPILVSGAAQTEYNGTFTVTAVAGNTLSWAVSGTPATPATGTFTVKIAPAGWERPYNSGNVSVFRSADIASSRRYFRVNDGMATDPNGYKVAECKLYESMTAVSTGTLRATCTWEKIFPATTAVKWLLVASGRTVYLFNPVFDAAQAGATDSNRFQCLVSFGDINSYRVGDTYQAFVNNSGTVPGQNLTVGEFGDSENSCVICRAYTGTGGAVSVFGSGVPRVVQTGATPGGLNPVDSSVPFVFPRLLTEYNATYTRVLRGTVPGIGQALVPYADALTAGSPTGSGYWQRFSGVSIGGTSRDVLLLACYGGQAPCGIAVDLSGPWH